MEVSYRNLLTNTIILETNTNSNIILKKQISMLQENCKMIDNLLLKFKDHRTKRALINVLGTAIKFITGNPDNNDLIEINKNLDSLFKNQEKVIKQVNQYTSFANHITNRYSDDLKIIQFNINSSLNVIANLSNTFEIISNVQYDNFLCIKLLEILRKIERTVTLAFSEITNLEILTYKDLTKITKHLRLIYSKPELIEFDNLHTFKLLEFSKSQIISVNDVITCILYIPILNPKSYQYSRVYPIPDVNNNLLLPPFKYNLINIEEELWTDEKCQSIEIQTLCLEKPTTNECSLINVEKCNYAEVNNNFKVYSQLNSGKLLLSAKTNLQVTEECNGKIEHIRVTNSALVSTDEQWNKLY